MHCGHRGAVKGFHVRKLIAGNIANIGKRYYWASEPHPWTCLRILIDEDDPPAPSRAFCACFTARGSCVQGGS